MSLTIIQKPLYKTIPANSDIIYTVSDNTSVASKFKVKYVAEIHILGSSTNSISSSNLVNTVKVSPNANGVGIMDLKSILSSHVDTQRTGSSLSTFKGNTGTNPIHLIDSLSQNDEGLNWFRVNFKIEYSDTISGTVYDSGQSVTDDYRLIYNGYLKDDNYLTQTGLDYGYDLDTNNYIMNSSSSKVLSRASNELYARLEDFGTVSFFDGLEAVNESFQTGSNGAGSKLQFIQINKYSETQGLGIHYITLDSSNGYVNSYTNNRNGKVCIAGIYPANLKSQLGIQWTNTEDSLSFYEFKIVDDLGIDVSQTYRVNVIKQDCKGYEGIRLAWLNQFGAFDYYTFNKKSVRTINTNKQNYNQHSGTWNGTSYNMNAGIGGTRSYNVSSKQSIQINTDYISEEDGIFLEGLTMSPEVYLIHKYEADDSSGLINKYVEPVLLTDSSITRKTKANDKLINFTFNIEKSKSTNSLNI